MFSITVLGKEKLEKAYFVTPNFVVNEDVFAENVQCAYIGNMDIATEEGLEKALATLKKVESKVLDTPEDDELQEHYRKCQKAYESAVYKRNMYITLVTSDLCYAHIEDDEIIFDVETEWDYVSYAYVASMVKGTQPVDTSENTLFQELYKAVISYCNAYIGVMEWDNDRKSGFTKIKDTLNKLLNRFMDFSDNDTYKNIKVDMNSAMTEEWIMNTYGFMKLGSQQVGKGAMGYKLNGTVRRNLSPDNSLNQAFRIFFSKKGCEIEKTPTKKVSRRVKF